MDGQESRQLIRQFRYSPPLMHNLDVQKPPPGTFTFLVIEVIPWANIFPIIVASALFNSAMITGGQFTAAANANHRNVTININGQILLSMLRIYSNAYPSYGKRHTTTANSK